MMTNIPALGIPKAAFIAVIGAFVSSIFVSTFLLPLVVAAILFFLFHESEEEKQGDKAGDENSEQPVKSEENVAHNKTTTKKETTSAKPGFEAELTGIKTVNSQSPELNISPKSTHAGSTSTDDDFTIIDQIGVGQPLDKSTSGAIGKDNAPKEKDTSTKQKDITDIATLKKEKSVDKSDSNSLSDCSDVVSEDKSTTENLMPAEEVINKKDSGDGSDFEIVDGDVKDFGPRSVHSQVMECLDRVEEKYGVPDIETDSPSSSSKDAEFSKENKSEVSKGKKSDKKTENPTKDEDTPAEDEKSTTKDNADASDFVKVTGRQEKRRNSKSSATAASSSAANSSSSSGSSSSSSSSSAKDEDKDPKKRSDEDESESVGEDGEEGYFVGDDGTVKQKKDKKPTIDDTNAFQEPEEQPYFPHVNSRLENDFYDLEKAKNCKEEGNKQFKAKDYELASDSYSDAIAFCPPHERSQLAIFHANRAACFMCLDEIDMALCDCNDALEFDREYTRAIQRRRDIYEKLQRWHDAHEDSKRLLELQPAEKRNTPEYSNIVKKNAYLKTKSEQQFEQEKTEMVGKLKDLGNTVLGKFGLSLDNFACEQDANGGYSIQFKNNK